MIDHNPPGAAASTQAPRVGTLLRQRREELGYALPDVAAALRIRQPYLEAIESSRYQDLPGQAYINGFLRTYAEHLGVDPGDVLSRFKEEMAGEPQKAELYFPEPVNENRVPGGALMLIAGLAVAVVYGGWYVLSSADRSVADLIPALPDRLAKTVETPEVPPDPAAVLPAQDAAELIGQSQPTAPEVGASTQSAGTAPFNGVSATDAAGQPAPAAPTEGAEGEADSEVPQLPEIGGNPAAPAPSQTAAAPPAPAEPPAPVPAAPADTTGQPPAPAPGTPAPAQQAAGRVFGQTGGPARVVIRATEDSWVEVRDGRGTNWALRTLRPGDSFRAPMVEGLTLNTGNAGGIVISIDGRDLPPLGGRGQVVKNVSLDPDRLAGGTAR
ncbi:MAG TPA: RodZ domain-containing protein [Azospirillaceae bacterium]|nr:RodZ domain-containing protein [Azospirillaceae bacterium]